MMCIWSFFLYYTYWDFLQYKLQALDVAGFCKGKETECDPGSRKEETNLESSYATDPYPYNGRQIYSNYSDALWLH